MRTTSAFRISIVLLCAAAAAILIVPALFGHDMWLEADSFQVEPGREVVARNGNGTIFVQSENAVTPDRIAQLMLVGPESRRPASPVAKVVGEWLELRWIPELPGNYWLALATRPMRLAMTGAEFNEYLEHDGVPGVLRRRQETGILDRDEVEEYSKYVKAFFQCGKALSSNFGAPLGLRIEIIPEQNPYLLTPGDGLPVRVLFEGEPLSGLTLHAGYDAAPSGVFSGETDGTGRAVIPITASGHWYIRGIHLIQVDGPDHSYESYWAAMTFAVRD